MSTTRTKKSKLPERETKIRKTFTLTPSIIERLARASRLRGMSESVYVEQALRLKLKEDENE